MSSFEQKIKEMDNRKSELRASFSSIIQNEKDERTKFLLMHMANCYMNLIDLRKERILLLEKQEFEKMNSKTAL